MHRIIKKKTTIVIIKLLSYIVDYIIKQNVNKRSNPKVVNFYKHSVI